MPTNSWSHFGRLGQGFLQSDILNEEKTLGTRLGLIQVTKAGHDNIKKVESSRCLSVKADIRI